jgi:enolase
MDVFEQRRLDYTMIELDGTETKRNLRANAFSPCPGLRPGGRQRGHAPVRYIGGVAARTLQSAVQHLNGGCTPTTTWTFRSS